MTTEEPQAAEVANHKPNPHQATVDGLRAMADFIEAHPEALNSYDTVDVTTCPTSMAKVARAGYGRMVKEPVGDWFYLVRSFSKTVRLKFLSSRDKVCKRVKVGEKIIPAEPEKILQQQIIPAKIVPAQPERVEDIYEWDCQPILAEVLDGETIDAATVAVEVRQAAPTDPSDLMTVDEAQANPEAFVAGMTEI